MVHMRFSYYYGTYVLPTKFFHKCKNFAYQMSKKMSDRQCDRLAAETPNCNPYLDDN